MPSSGNFPGEGVYSIRIYLEQLDTSSKYVYSLTFSQGLIFIIYTMAAVAVRTFGPRALDKHRVVMIELSGFQVLYGSPCSYHMR